MSQIGSNSEHYLQQLVQGAKQERLEEGATYD